MNKVKNKKQENQNFIQSENRKKITSVWIKFYKQLSKGDKTEIADAVYDALGNAKGLYSRHTIAVYLGELDVIHDKFDYWIKLIFGATLQTLHEKADRVHQAFTDNISLLETTINNAYNGEETSI